MKELSIEEKAKAYDEALEKAKMVLQERGNEPDGASMLSNLFPELAESEDERIRKDCIKYLDLEYQHCSTNEDKIKIEKCIDWLEKQGRFISNTSIVASNEESLIPDIDKPKFAVGAYVTDDGETYFLIIGYADSMYQLETVEGTSGRFPKEIVERKFRLWSIEDAKDGDVLANCNIICMLEKLDKEGDVVTHCVYTVQDGFEVLCGSRTIGPFNLKPATKEQRDLLFQKMKETGYEWDAEKKELKKFSIENTVQTIEIQKPVEWSEEDELRIENLIAILEGRGYPDYIDWLKSLKDRVQPQSKQKWGEEDEDMIERIISFVKPYTTYPSHEDIKYRGEMVQWLRDLKDKCLPLSKQEWSEEDEKMIRALVSMCDVWATSHQFYPKENKEMEALKTWLKSLRPQNTWKPSEEQMDALHYVTNFDYGGHKSILVSLYEQLKKLK